MQQMVFPNEAEAQAARGRITVGHVVRRPRQGAQSQSGRRRPRHDRKIAIIDPAIADAAFALPSGEVSQPVQGRFGVALVKIGKIEPGVTPTYESVAAQ